MIEKTTIYHSTLKQVGEIEVEVVDAAFKSKYPDKYKNDQYSVKLKHEGKDHYYTTSDQKVANYLGSFKGKTVKISAAEGGRLNISGEDSEPAGKVTSKEVEKRYHPDPEEVQVALDAAVEKASKAISSCVAAAMKVKKDYEDSTSSAMTDEHFQSICSSLWIYVSQHGETGRRNGKSIVASL